MGVKQLKSYVPKKNKMDKQFTNKDAFKVAEEIGYNKAIEDAIKIVQQIIPQYPINCDLIVKELKLKEKK